MFSATYLTEKGTADIVLLERAATKYNERWTCNVDEMNGCTSDGEILYDFLAGRALYTTRRRVLSI